MVATLLPRLRFDLEFLPSPVAAQPGLMVRDPYRYSDVTLVIPPLITRCLGLFDGAHTDLDLRELLVRLTGRIDQVGEVVEQVTRTLSGAGFLMDTTFAELRARRHQEFTDAPTRPAVHAGGGYPQDRTELDRTLVAWRQAAPVGMAPANADEQVIAIAAPHASPSAAVATYAAAYQALPARADDRTFVILGTSHYGAPARLGLTRKSFETPLGSAITDVGLVDELARAAPAAFASEDYCHAIEHSIEFQVLFLQSRYGPSVRILPILCGPYLAAHPESDPVVARGLDALGALHAAHRDRLLWVLGVDMAHIGPRYGDAAPARAHQGEMTRVAARDEERMDRLAAGDAGGFWKLVRDRAVGAADGDGDRDDLKWCGAAPFYAFLRAVPDVRGRVLHYDHWDIDDTSVVSFAAMAFSHPSKP